MLMRKTDCSGVQIVEHDMPHDTQALPGIFDCRGHGKSEKDHEKAQNTQRQKGRPLAPPPLTVATLSLQNRRP